MAIIKFIDLVSCSSQDLRYRARNLMFYHLKKPWLSSPSDTSRQIEAEFQLYRSTEIDFIDLGNSGSSTIEVQVSRSSNPTIYTTLVPAVTMLSLADLKEGNDKNSVYMFNLCNMVPAIAKQKWDRVKIICKQPYLKKIQFGLKFFLLRTKNDWVIQSKNETLDLFVEKKSHYSAPLRDQCARQSDTPDKVISRGQKLVQASKAQHSLTSKSLEDSFNEDARVFFIACCAEDFKTLPFKVWMDEFERQRQHKLNPKETILFEDIYREFKVYPSVAEMDNISIPSYNYAELLLSESIEIGVVVNSSTDKSDVNVADFNAIKLSNVPLSKNGCKRDSSFKLNANKSKRSSSHNLNSQNISDELLIHEKDSSQHQNGNSSSVKTAFPLHPSVSSLRSQNNSPDLSKPIKHHPKYHHKESTLVRSVSESPKHNNVHSSVKRRCESSSNAGSSKKNKSFEQFPTRGKEGYNRPEDFIQSDGSQPSTSKGFTLVDCPICRDSFHPSLIEEHAATCGEFNDHKFNESSMSDSKKTDPCPYCLAKFSSREVNLHIEKCFRYH